jgi:hypothetical protein
MPNPYQTALHSYEGFNTAREQNPQRSAKDSFYAHSQGVAAPIDDKGKLGDWFNQNVRAGMEADGHRITDVQGDKFRFNNWQGDYWVDFGRGAGAPGGALAWQAEDANAPTSHAMQQGSARPIQSGNGLFDQIMASLQQQTTPDPQELLLQQLR